MRMAMPMPAVDGTAAVGTVDAADAMLTPRKAVHRVPKRLERAQRRPAIRLLRVLRRVPNPQAVVRAAPVGVAVVAASIWECRSWRPVAAAVEEVVVAVVGSGIRWGTRRPARSRNLHGPAHHRRTNRDVLRQRSGGHLDASTVVGLRLAGYARRV